jgi:hypothetical protein
MDDATFDRLAQSWALPGSRRRLLAGLVAGAFGLVGLGEAGAAACRPVGSVCREHANCCSKRCGDKDATGRRRCACQESGDCPPPATCRAVTCETGACVASVVADTTPCTASGGAAGTCQGGACVVPTTTTTTTSTTTTSSLLPIGAACTASSQCVPAGPSFSGACACRRGDCVGGGQCAARGCVTGTATVKIPEAPGEAVNVCVTAATAFDCAAAACPAGQACGHPPFSNNPFCFVLA